jgi:hypothetical protein
VVVENTAKLEKNIRTRKEEFIYAASKKVV